MRRSSEEGYAIFRWIGGVFRWDFGLSCQDTVPVKDLIEAMHKRRLVLPGKDLRLYETGCSGM